MFGRVKSMMAEGLSDYEIGRRLDVSRSTIQNWRHRDTPPRGCEPEPHTYRPEHRATYAYLLGSYLGDGVIWRSGNRSWRLSITCDALYPKIVEEVAAAVGRCFPRSNVCVNEKSGAGAYVVCASSGLLELAFPQHGPGRKHRRTIRLAPWQAEITREHPEMLLRGLIHSDGSRSINRFKTELPSGRVAEYAYPRYFFTNHSADIRRIFCEHCDLIGVRWTQSNPRNISISHRDSVALLDSFIGPKA